MTSKEILIITTTLITVLLSGCSYSYMDEDGRKHIVGLVSMTIDSSLHRDQIAGHQVSVKSIGIAMISTPVSSGIAIGYSKEELLAVKDHSLVLLRSHVSETEQPSNKGE